jgi:hypothetical protein
MSIIKELKYTKAKELKELFPLYPTVRKEDNNTFSTLVRKKYSVKYYLIPIRVSGENEAKAIHNLHNTVHRYLMIGQLDFLDTEDDGQENEVTRLKKL